MESRERRRAAVTKIAKVLHDRIYGEGIDDVMDRLTAFRVVAQARDIRLPFETAYSILTYFNAALDADDDAAFEFFERCMTLIAKYKLTR